MVPANLDGRDRCLDPPSSGAVPARTGHPPDSDVLIRRRTVLDPFSGTATTALAAAQCGRNSIGFEIDAAYFEYACKRLTTKARGLFSPTTLELYP